MSSDLIGPTIGLLAALAAIGRSHFASRAALAEAEKKRAEEAARVSAMLEATIKSTEAAYLDRVGDLDARFARCEEERARDRREHTSQMGAANHEIAGLKSRVTTLESELRTERKRAK